MTEPPIQAITDAISSFEDGAIEVVQLQGRLEAVVATLDNSEREVLDELRRVDAALEHIVFAEPAARQREATLTAAARLRVIVDAQPTDG